MITYTRSAFGLNLLFRLHGSATYRSFLPGLAGMGLFYLFRSFPEMEDRDLDHPYVIGIVVSGITFLIVFRASQGYSRYWEATTCCYQMASKWMDATMHTASYHMQSEQYAHMRPPSFSDYAHLDASFLTRDRERVRFSERGSKKRLMNPHRAVMNSINAITPKDDSLTEDSEPELERKLSRRGGFSFISRLSSKKSFRLSSRRNFSSESNNDSFDSSSRYNRARGSLSRSFRLSTISESFRLSTNFDDWEEERKRKEKTQPRFLTGPARLDGNWSAVFDQQPPTATFYDPVEDDIPPDPRGFASTAGGRMPALFLQELAHLSSLLMAVALSTLRNDIDGAESPLDLYEPGSPWPKQDPLQCPDLYPNRWDRLRDTTLFFMGKYRSPEERTKYNAKRPMPVLGGVSDAEIRFLQMARGPKAKTTLCWQWLSEFIVREHLSGSMGNVSPAIISRTIQFLSDGMSQYNNGRKIMSIPFPFVHAQHSAIFVIVLVLIIPYMMEQYTMDTWSGALLTFFSISILAGTHEVARELENPFRNVPNELPLVFFMAEYNETLLTMYSGFHPDFFWKPPSKLCNKNVGSSGNGDEGRTRSSLDSVPEASEMPECSPETLLHSSPDTGPDTVTETTIEFSPMGISQPIPSDEKKNDVNEESVGENEIDKLKNIVIEQGKIMSRMLEEQARLNRMVEATLHQPMSKAA